MFEVCMFNVCLQYCNCFLVFHVFVSDPQWYPARQSIRLDPSTY